MIPVGRVQPDAKQGGLFETPEKNLVPKQADRSPPGSPDAVDHTSGEKGLPVFQINYRADPCRVGKPLLPHSPLRLLSQKPRRGDESPERNPTAGKRFFASPQKLRGLGKRRIMEFPLARSVMASDQTGSHTLPFLGWPKMIVPMQDCFMPCGDLCPEPRGEVGVLIDPAPMVMIGDHKQRSHGYPLLSKIPQHLINPGPGDR